MITLSTSGDFTKTAKFLDSMKKAVKMDGILDTCGKRGVEALSSATPTDSGTTASSWSYELEQNGESATITFKNSNVNKGVNIAIILQYGHGTGTGGWVEGRDYINPAIQPIFDEIVEKAWKEVTKL